jgi:hypothetical protein
LTQTSIFDTIIKHLWSRAKRPEESEINREDKSGHKNPKKSKAKSIDRWPQKRYNIRVR